MHHNQGFLTQQSQKTLDCHMQYTGSRIDGNGSWLYMGRFSLSEAMSVDPNSAFGERT